MQLRAVKQPFVFPGLNPRAVDFLMLQGKWIQCDEYWTFDQSKEGSTGGIIFDEDKLDEENIYSAITGVYIRDKVLITRTHEVVTSEDGDVITALYKYRLKDDSWVWERIDQIIDGTRPVLCLADEYGEIAFRWTDEEIEEAIVFMIENGLLE